MIILACDNALWVEVITGSHTTCSPMQGKPLHPLDFPLQGWHAFKGEVHGKVYLCPQVSSCCPAMILGVYYITNGSYTCTYMYIKTPPPSFECLDMWCNLTQ